MLHEPGQGRPADVDILDDHPATGAHRGDQDGQLLLALRKVLQHRPRMGQVEAVPFERSGEHVMRAHLEVVAAVPVDEARVQIGGQHRAGGPDLVGQPQREAATATAYLQAAPARPEATLDQVAPRGSVEQRLQARQSLSLPLPRLIEHVRAHLSLPRSPSR